MKALFWVIAAGAISAGASIPLIGNYHGYCFEKRRFLSDAEFVQIALRHQSRLIEDMTNSPSQEEIENYLAQHPRCCRVELRSNAPESPFLDELFGFKKTWVTLLYKRKVHDGGGVENYVDYVSVLPCGRVSESGGVPVSEDQMRRRLEGIKPKDRS